MRHALWVTKVVERLFPARYFTIRGDGLVAAFAVHVKYVVRHGCPCSAWRNPKHDRGSEDSGAEGIMDRFWSQII